MKQQPEFLIPGDLVKREGKEAIVLGSYAILNSKDMDFVSSLSDNRFHDYRIVYTEDGFSPLTYVRDSELTLIGYADDQLRQIVLQRVTNLYNQMIAPKRN